MVGFLLLVARKVVPPLIIYMVVSWWSIAQGVEPTIGNIIGAAAAFGTVVVSFKIGF